MSSFDPRVYVWAKCVPEILVGDFHKSLRFYRTLGFVDQYQRDGFAYLDYRGAQFMIAQQDGWWETGTLERPLGRGVNFQFATDEIDRLIERLISIGHDLYEDKREKWRDLGGHRVGAAEFLVQDPDGYLLRFSQPIAPTG